LLEKQAEVSHAGLVGAIKKNHAKSVGVVFCDCRHWHDKSRTTGAVAQS